VPSIYKSDYTGTFMFSKNNYEDGKIGTAGDRTENQEPTEEEVKTEDLQSEASLLKKIKQQNQFMNE